MWDTLYLVTVENTKMSNNESSSHFDHAMMTNGGGEIVSKDEENVHEFD